MKHHTTACNPAPHTIVLRRRTSRRLAAIGAALFAVLVPLAVDSIPSGATTRVPQVATSAFPSGIVSAREPSGKAPPGATALPGYRLTYHQDFTAGTLPPEWGRFNGVAGGNPGSMFLPNHVLVGGGMARIVTYRDPANNGGWASGGMCPCTHPTRYGAYFVRSRVTGPGGNVSELLWPVAPVWPPEVDFNEMGRPTDSTSWTVHYGHGHTFVQRRHNFDMTRWHTWGVIWTPRLLTFTIDGKAWGTLSTFSRIPHIAMTLDIQSETWCPGTEACPAQPSALQVDWVTQYVPG